MDSDLPAVLADAARSAIAADITDEVLTIVLPVAVARKLHDLVRTHRPDALSQAMRRKPQLALAITQQ